MFHLDELPVGRQQSWCLPNQRELQELQTTHRWVLQRVLRTSLWQELALQKPVLVTHQILLSLHQTHRVPVQVYSRRVHLLQEQVHYQKDRQ